MIEAMVRSGDVAGAQKVILGELEKKFGDVARATADSKVQLTNSINDIKEEIGKTMLPALDSAAQAVLPILQRLTEWIKANPELAKSIGLIAVALGAFLAVGGSLIIMLGTLAASLAVIGVSLAAGGAARRNLGRVLETPRLFALANGLLQPESVDLERHSRSVRDCVFACPHPACHRLPGHRTPERSLGHGPGRIIGDPGS